MDYRSVKGAETRSASQRNEASTVALFRINRIKVRVRAPIQLVEWHLVFHRCVGGEIRLVRKAGEHGVGRRIHLVHRRKTEDQFDRAEQARLVVINMHDRPSPGVGAGNIGCSSETACVINTIMGIRFHPEDAGIFPKRAVADRFDNFSES